MRAVRRKVREKEDDKGMMKNLNGKKQKGEKNKRKTRVKQKTMRGESQSMTRVKHE